MDDLFQARNVNLSLPIAPTDLPLPTQSMAITLNFMENGARLNTKLPHALANPCVITEKWCNTSVTS